MLVGEASACDFHHHEKPGLVNGTNENDELTTIDT